MGVLAWLGVPAAATILAIVWVHWASRTRGPAETAESLAERERFVAAFARPQPRRRAPQRPRQEAGSRSRTATATRPPQEIDLRSRAESRPRPRAHSAR
jgi:hypothetical protein